MCLDVRCASSRTHPSKLIFDKEFSNERFTQTLKIKIISHAEFDLPEAENSGTHFDICGMPECSGNRGSSRKMLANVAFRFLPLKGVVP